MRLHLIVALATILMLIPASAQGTPNRVSTEAAGPGPELAGSLAVYQRPSDTNRILRAAGPGSAPRTLFSTPIPQNDPSDDCCSSISSFFWSVSATRLALQTYRADYAKATPAGSQLSLSAGPLDGTRPQIYGCTSGDDVPVGPFDVDGDRIAFVRGSCRDPQDIVVRDLATGATVTTVPASPGSDYMSVALAGRYLAIGTRPNDANQQDDWPLVVRDLVTGTNVTTTQTAGNFDVQADGKLVNVATIAGPGGCRTSVAWHAPGDPARRTLPFCPDGRPRIAADRVLLRTRTLADDGDSGELVLSDLAGGARPLVRSRALDAIGPDYDLDPAGAAYYVGTCSPRRGAIYTDDLAPAEPVSVRTDCPIRFVGRRLRARGNKTVTVRLRCPNGCGGELQLRPRRGNARLTPYKGFAGGPGAVNVKVKLRKAARRTLARTGRLKARIVANSSDLPSGSSFVSVRRVTVVGRRR